MDFALSAEQALLQDQIDRALAERMPPEAVARHVRERRGFDGDLWQTACDLGIPGLLVPEVLGGAGLGLLDTALVAEMAGRHAVPLPFLGPVVAAPLALTLAGSPDQQAEFLPQIADGSLRVAVAISESLAGARAGAGVQYQERRLSGAARVALDMGEPGLVLVADMTGGLHLVAVATEGVGVTPLDVVDRTKNVAALQLDGITPVATLPGRALDRLGAALRVVAAADLLGAAGRMLDTAVDYARVRHQFGRPTGSFQAVKHLCAEIAAEVEPGRALVWYAAHALDENLPDAGLTALHAKAYMADAARVAARNATEVHGGIGITEELGLHLWFKRITFTGQLFGGPSRLREEAAALQGFGPAELRRAAAA